MVHDHALRFIACQPPSKIIMKITQQLKAERGAKHGTVKVHYHLNGVVMISVQYKAQHCMKSYNLLLICHMSKNDCFVLVHFLYFHSCFYMSILSQSFAFFCIRSTINRPILSKIF